jgi:carbon-monoxide dehydrogenase medium subunit
MPEPSVSYAAPRTVDALYELLDRDLDHTIIAGGMTLMPLLNRGIGNRDRLISLARVEGFDLIELRETQLFIGATATHTVVATSSLVAKHAPILARAASGIGDVQIRNRGTIGGVVAYGNAGADYLTALPALGAQVLVGSSSGVREVAVEDFVAGLCQTDLAFNEVVIGVNVPVVGTAPSAFERYFRIQGAAPTITAATVLRTSGARLSVGGATPRPTVLELSALDERGLLSIDQAVADLDAAISQDPFGDHLNPPHYRKAMAAVFARRVLTEARGARRG